MEITDKSLEGMIEAIYQQLKATEIGAPTSTIINKKGIFSSMDEAIEEAAKAQKILFQSKLAMREKIIEAIRDEARKYVDELSRMGVEDTGMGRVSDKILKHELVLDKTPGFEDLKAFAYSGDDGLTVMELSPFGVIGAITPSTNPSETILCNSIGMIAAGNSVVFAPHPGAKNVSIRTVEIINDAIERVGGPKNLVVTIDTPSIDNTNAMIANPNIKMLVATGGPGVVRAIMESGKKAIGAGAGNPPAFVDETADIPKAAADIIAGSSFDNNLPCIAEKVVVAMSGIVEYLIFEMQKNGAYYLSDEKDIKKLTDMVMPNGKPSRSYVGRDASVILKDIGIDVPEDTRSVILEVDRNHILAVEEQLMPVLPIVRVDSIEEGLELSKRLEAGNRHTAMIHSKNIDVLSRYARDMETTILVKNGPSYAGIGVGGEGHTTFTIAGPTGEGLTSARSFARNRRCVLVGGLSIK